MRPLLHLPIWPLVALLLFSAPAICVEAQAVAQLRIVVRDATATPQPGIQIQIDTGDGSGPVIHVTDDAGDTGPILAPTRLVTITQVLDVDGTPLSHEMTTLDGLLVIPLMDDLTIPWAYDRASRSVITLPRTMTNEAFPELPMLADAEVVPTALAATPGASAAVVIDAPSAPAGPPWWVWAFLGAVLCAGLGLGLGMWWMVRRSRPSPRRRQGGR